MNKDAIFMSQKIPKEQKLKSDNQIQFLFNKGKSIFFYPIKMQYYLQSETTERKGLQCGVSVSKKYFKTAVDRNELKSKMREGFRLNKTKLEKTLLSDEKNLVIMFLYVGKTKLEQSEITEAIIVLIKKLLKKFNNPIADKEADL